MSGRWWKGEQAGKYDVDFTLPVAPRRVKSASSSPSSERRVSLTRPSPRTGSLQAAVRDWRYLQGPSLSLKRGRGPACAGVDDH